MIIEKDSNGTITSIYKRDEGLSERIIENIETPKITGNKKILGKGRLLFYVNFEESTGELIKNNAYELLELIE